MGENNSIGSMADKFPKEYQQNTNQKKTDNNDVQRKQQNNISEGYVSEKFECLTEDNIAYMISNAQCIAEKIAGDKDSYTQIRKFYDELLLLQKKVKYNDIKYNDNGYKKIEPMIYLLKSKSAYAHGRKNIHNTFFKFMTNYIDYIKNTNDLDNFILYFEAVLGYLKYHENKGE